ncbi:hypothetical protein ACFORG_12225 [Lutimaribacter marinistellae]|uniref:Uncharacterized protein n=1 Tax=Lutimaribacter marinistellae TaxID=1820329 RepID=A0ABV7TJF1_9RHOB
MNNKLLSRVELTLMERALRAPDGIFVAEITRSSGISVRETANAFKNLRGRGFLSSKGSTLVLTSKGRGWIMANQEMFAFSGNKPWRDVPARFKSSQSLPFQPYAPRISKLSRTHFTIGNQEDE